jgi:hypothetical protein
MRKSRAATHDSLFGVNPQQEIIARSGNDGPEVVQVST